MDTSLFIVLSLWLAMYVLLPAFRDKTAPSESGEALTPGFRAEVGSILASLHDLEYDEQTGKIAAEDLSSMRTQLQMRLVEAIRWAGYEKRFLDEAGAPRLDLLEPLAIE
jgi:hypothetical protein